MKLLLAFLLIPIGIAVYFALAFWAGWPQHIPWLAFAFLAVGIACLLTIVFKERSLVPVATTLFGVALSVLFAWWTLAYSEYAPSPSESLDAGDSMPLDALAKVDLLDAAGSPQTASTALRPAANATAKLLVFYRGYW